MIDREGRAEWNSEIENDRSEEIERERRELEEKRLREEVHRLSSIEEKRREKLRERNKRRRYRRRVEKQQGDLRDRIGPKRKNL